MKLKHILYWIVAIPAVIVIGASIILDWLIWLYFGISGVLGLATWRYECWSFDVPKGYFWNCPWKTTYKQAWKDATNK